MLKFRAIPTNAKIKSLEFCFDNMEDFDAGIETIEDTIEDMEVKIELVDCSLDLEPIDTDNIDFNSDNIEEWIDRFDIIHYMSSYERRAFTYLYNDIGYDAEEALDKYKDVILFQGSVGEYAEEMYRECHEKVPEILEFYIDWDEMGKDMEINSDIINIGDGWLVTNSNEF